MKSADRARKKRLWFDKGIEALAQIGESPGGYVCPTCLLVFGEDDFDSLSFEDVPPKRIGGRPLVLTCKPCNNNFGTKLDASIVGLQVNLDFARAELTKPIKGVFKIGESKLRASIQNTGDGIVIFGSPKESASVRDGITDALSGASEPPAFNLELSEGRHKPKRAYVGFLRHAYLVGFALWGYTYVAWPAFDKVREQIHRYDEVILPHFSIDIPEFPSRTNVVAILTDPAWLEAVVVVMGPTAIFLPRRSSVDPYDQLAARVSDGQRVQLDGRTIVWPIAPMHGLDYLDQA